MSKQTAYLALRLPTLNQLIADAKLLGSKGGRRWSRYADVKRAYGRVLVPILKKAFVPIDSPVSIHFTYVVTNLRAGDLDNMDAGARKLILDAMVVAKILPNDTLRWVQSLSADFQIGEDRSIIIDVSEVSEKCRC